MAKAPHGNGSQQRPHHPGHRRRRRRAVRRPPAGDPERARDRQQRQPPGARGRPASRREHRAHASPWTPPKAWCAARRSPTPASRSRCRSATSTLGRIMNVIGEPIDEAGPVDRPRPPRHPPAGAVLRRPVDRGADPRHRHQGRRPARPLRQGRQDRPVRRRRRRQDRAHPGADQQHRQGPRRLLGASPASASAPARATTSITR